MIELSKEVMELTIFLLGDSMWNYPAIYEPHEFRKQMGSHSIVACCAYNKLVKGSILVMGFFNMIRKSVEVATEESANHMNSPFDKGHEMLGKSASVLQFCLAWRERHRMISPQSATYYSYWSHQYN